MSTTIAQLTAIKTLDIRQKVCYSGQMRMIIIRICTIIEQSLLSEPRAGLNIEQFSASVPLIIAAGQCNSRRTLERSSWGSIRSANHGVCKGKWLVSSKKYCLAASSARRASRRMELGWKCVVRCTPGFTRAFSWEFFQRKFREFSADTEKTYIPHAHILC